MPDEPKRTPSVMSGFGEAMGLAAEIVATTFVGIGLGWLISRWLGNTPLFVMLGAILGGAAGITRLYRQWSRNAK